MGIPLGPADFTRGAAKPLDDSFIVADITARDAIVSGIRYDGMLVYAVADQTMYQLQGGVTNSDWVGVGGASTSANQANLIENLGLSTSVNPSGGFDLTINVTQANGSALSSGAGAVNVAMRNPTLTSGEYSVRQITAPLSMTLDFLSSLGHRNGVDHPIWVYLIDNAGTLELAVSTVLFNEDLGIVTTLSEGSGYASSNAEMYSTIGRTNVPFRVVGKLISNQATAGSWITPISKIILNPDQNEIIESRVWTSNGQVIPTTSTTKVQFNQIDLDTHNCFSGSPNFQFVVPKTGFLKFGGYVTIQIPVNINATLTTSIYVNGNLYKEKYTTISNVANAYTLELDVRSFAVKGQVWDFRVSQNTGADRFLISSSGYSSVSFIME